MDSPPRPQHHQARQIGEGGEEESYAEQMVRRAEAAEAEASHIREAYRELEDVYGQTVSLGDAMARKLAEQAETIATLHAALAAMREEQEAAQAQNKTLIEHINALHARINSMEGGDSVSTEL